MYQRMPNYYNQNQYNPNGQPQYYHPYEQQMMYHQSPYPSDPSPPPTPFSQYAKPAQPQNWPVFMQQNPNYFPEQQQSAQQGNSFVNYFQDQNGQVDFGKMLSTVSQVANTFQQVTPVVQQINSMIKSFR